MESGAGQRCVSNSIDYLAPEKANVILQAGGASSPCANVMLSDDEHFKEQEGGGCENLHWDVKTGAFDSSFVDEGMHGLDCGDKRKPSKVARVALVACHNHSASIVETVVDSEVREPTLARTETANNGCSQYKESLPSRSSGDDLEKEAEVHGLRNRQGTKVDNTNSTEGSESEKMPQEEHIWPGGAVTCTKNGSTDGGIELKQKSGNKKPGKQGKGARTTMTSRKVHETTRMEELRAKEEAETNRKVHESLDNFIRQTIRCEPYMNFSNRPGDNPMQRLRADLFENHVAGKIAKGLKVDSGCDASSPTGIATDDSLGMDGHSIDIDGFREVSNTSPMAIAGMGRNFQRSLNAPGGVVAFTQATAKGTDLQGWLSSTKMLSARCDKCSREFFSSLNCRRHMRGHRRSMHAEKEDLSRERSKVAAFWDRLTPEEASSIVSYEKMEIEDLLGQAALKGLAVFIQQPGLASLPYDIRKAGASLLDIVQTKPSAPPISSEKLLSILDEASERTFLSSGTSLTAQRFVFHGGAAKIGLEEKNVVASMGFHIEVRLVRAWMAEKEAEALRCQQALFREEEAEQQKRAKLLEKKRMKKMRQKERKGSTSVLICHVLENESFDDDRKSRGIGKEDEFHTATGSSSSWFQELAEIDTSEDLRRRAARDVLDKQEERKLESFARGRSVEEVSLDDSRDDLSLFEQRLQSGSCRDVCEVFFGKETSLTKECIAPHKIANILPLPVEQIPWDRDINARLAHILPTRGTGRAEEKQTVLYYCKRKEERVGADLKKPKFHRCETERRSIRISRDKHRNSYFESVQRPLRDYRSSDGRYGDAVNSTFKLLRKHNPYTLMVGGADAESPNFTRAQHYYKPTGLNRDLSSGGKGQVVWTRKIPLLSVSMFKNRTEGLVRRDRETRTVANTSGMNTSGMKRINLSQGVISRVASIRDGIGGSSMIDEWMRKETAATSDSLEASNLNESRLVGSGEEVVVIDREDLTDALLVGSLSVPLGKFAAVSVAQTKTRSCAVNPFQSSDFFQGVSGLASFVQKVASSSNLRRASGREGAVNRLSKEVGDPDKARPQDHRASSKPHSSLLSPGRRDNGRFSTALGHERLARQGFWHDSSGRHVFTKVWRPIGTVGTVGDRQYTSAPGLNVTGGANPLLFHDNRCLHEASTVPGWSENNRGKDANQHRLVREDEFYNNRYGRPLVVRFGSGRNLNDRSAENLSFDHTLCTESVSEILLGKAAESSRRNGMEAALLALGRCSLSGVVEDAESFLAERWQMALAQASVDQVLEINAGAFLTDTEETNFLDMVLLQISTQTPGPYPALPETK